MADAELQTEYLEPTSAVRLVHDDFLDSSELNSFLMECRDGLEETLLRNVQSKAFDNHDVSWDEGHDQVDCIHSLRHRAAAVSNGGADACTAVAWNASGTVVAAAYGPLDRHDWPLCESVLCTWAVLRRTLDPSKADIALMLPDSLTCLAFHPENPSLLAGGAFNGDVMLWDLSASGDLLVGKSVMDAYTHHDPVQQLAWTRHPAHRGHVLCSLSSEGRLLLWSPDARMRYPSLGFRLTTLATHAAAPRKPEGCASFAFSHEDPTTFVVGLEAGQLYKCSLLANEERSVELVQMQRGEAKWSAAAAALMTRVPASHYPRLKLRIEKEAVLAHETEVSPRTVFAAQPEPDVLFRSPASFAYEAHSGPVYNTSFSPFHRNLFLSVATDASVRVHLSTSQTCHWDVQPSLLPVGPALQHAAPPPCSGHRTMCNVDLRV